MLLASVLAFAFLWLLLRATANTARSEATAEARADAAVAALEVTVTRAETGRKAVAAARDQMAVGKTPAAVVRANDEKWRNRK